MMEMNTQMKPVMIPNRLWLSETNSSHHMGASSAISPVTITLLVVRRSNFALLEYTVVAELTCLCLSGSALNSVERWKLVHASNHRPSGGRLRELMAIRSPSCSLRLTYLSSGVIAPFASRAITLSICRLSAHGLARILAKTSMN
jgi:hypothetical protein